MYRGKVAVVGRKDQANRRIVVRAFVDGNEKPGIARLFPAQFILQKIASAGDYLGAFDHDGLGHERLATSHASNQDGFAG